MYRIIGSPPYTCRFGVANVSYVVDMILSHTSRQHFMLPIAMTGGNG